MRRVLIVDSGDFKRRFISVDVTPNPMPLLADLREKLEEESVSYDTVLYLEKGDDPIVLKAPDLNLGPFPWKRLASVLSGAVVGDAHRSRDRVSEYS